MDWLRELDQAIVPLRRRLAKKAAARQAARLGYPLFSARMKDRMDRWRDGKQPNPYTAISAKLDGQAYMRSLGHPVPEIYGIYPSLNAIPRLEDLPANVVLKPNTASSGVGVFLMRGGFDLARGRRFTRDQLVAAAEAESAKKDKAITGSWIAEELLFGFDGREEPALDFKLFCFGPKVVAMQVNRHTGLPDFPLQRWYFDPDWKRLPFRFRWQCYPERGPLAKPPCLDEMLAIAADVGGRLNIFIRIDMYATDHGPVFGEFTAYPSHGMGYTPRADAWMGGFWKTRDGGL